MSKLLFHYVRFETPEGEVWIDPETITSVEKHLGEVYIHADGRQWHVPLTVSEVWEVLAKEMGEARR